MRHLRFIPAQPATPHNAIPFPKQRGTSTPDASDIERALSAMDRASRKLDDLAKQLNCLGYFDESDPDRPRAA